MIIEARERVVNVQGTIRRAQKLENAGDAQGALAAYQSVLDVFPNNVRAKKAVQSLNDRMHNPPATVLETLRGQYEAGQWAQVVAECRSLISQFPKSDALWTIIGGAAQQLGHHDVAIPAFSMVTELRPTAQAHANLAGAFLGVGMHDEAWPWFDKAYQKSGDPQYLLNAGQSKLYAGLIFDAIIDLEKYRSTGPRSIVGLAALAEAYLQSGQAQEAAKLYAIAVKMDPENAQIHNNYGVALRAVGRLDAAMESTQRAIALDPSHASAYQNLASLFVDQNAIEKAIQAYERTIAIEPSMHAAHAQKLHFQAKLCDWACWDEFRTIAATLGTSGEPVAPFALLGLEDYPIRQRQRAERAAQKWQLGNRDFAPSDGDKIRVGYFSADLFEHATLHLFAGVLEQHDLDRFEIYIYGLNAPADSPQLDQIKASVTGFRQVHDLPDQAIVAMARQDRLDIAVDLKGYTLGARTSIFCAGLAPVQISYLGYPGTMGSACMDYLIADATVIPDEAHQYYCEKVLNLPHCYQPNDNRRPVPAATDTRRDHGLPDDAVVLYCFNNSYKICPAVFDIWMRVLTRTHDAVLWLLDCGEAAKSNLVSRAVARGIAPERLIFAPKTDHAAHLNRQTHADLFVDTFNYNAHTTASDALWAGVPLVTLAGAQFSARVGASLLNAMALPELITTDVAEYEKLIGELAEDAKRLRELRGKVLAHRFTTPLFDTVGYVRDLEAAYRSVVPK